MFSIASLQVFYFLCIVKSNLSYHETILSLHVSPINYHDIRFFLHKPRSNFIVSKLALWKKYTMSIKPYSNFLKISLCFVKYHGKVRDLLSFLEKPRKTFLQFDLQKNFVKHIEILPLLLSKKFIGDTFLIIDIALRNLDLSIKIAQGFFEIIDYRYR